MSGTHPAASLAWPSRTGDLVDDPIPVTDAFEGDRCAWGIVFEEIADGAGDVIDPHLLHETAFMVENSELRIPSMSVTTDLIIHGAAPPSLSVVGIQQV
jgi:hypothetical protein